LISVAHIYIKWPEGPVAEQTLRQFEEKCKFPSVIGAIDCTDIEIRAPKQNKERTAPASSYRQ